MSALGSSGVSRSRARSLGCERFELDREPISAALDAAENAAFRGDLSGLRAAAADLKPSDRRASMGIRDPQPAGGPAAGRDQEVEPFAALLQAVAKVDLDALRDAAARAGRLGSEELDQLARALADCAKGGVAGAFLCAFLREPLALQSLSGSRLRWLKGRHFPLIPGAALAAFAAPPNLMAWRSGATLALMNPRASL